MIFVAAIFRTGVCDIDSTVWTAMQDWVQMIFSSACRSGWVITDPLHGDLCCYILSPDSVPASVQQSWSRYPSKPFIWSRRVCDSVWIKLWRDAGTGLGLQIEDCTQCTQTHKKFLAVSHHWDSLLLQWKCNKTKQTPKFPFTELYRSSRKKIMKTPTIVWEHL